MEERETEGSEGVREEKNERDGSQGGNETVLDKVIKRRRN